MTEKPKQIPETVSEEAKDKISSLLNFMECNHPKMELHEQVFILQSVAEGREIGVIAYRCQDCGFLAFFSVED